MARIPDEKPLIGHLVRLDPTQESDRDDLIDALDDPRVFSSGMRVAPRTGWRRSRT